MPTAGASSSRGRARPAVLVLAAVALLPVACGDDRTTAAPAPSAEPSLAPTTLAMVDGWRNGLAEPDGRAVVGAPDEAFGVLEVAHDEATVRALWDAVVPPGLPARDGDPHEPGLYGDLADVDLDEQAVVLWSSGESGSCASWLGGVRTDADGVVRVRTAGVGGTCTADYQRYQVLVAVDRDDVPPPEELPSARGAFGGGDDHLRLVVSAFPCCSVPG